MNIDALAAFILATPMWMAAAVRLLTGRVNVTKRIDREGSSVFGRSRATRNRRTYSRTHDSKEFWGYVIPQLLIATLLTAFGIWALVTDSHLIFD
jgi:hypothetical protein